MTVTSGIITPSLALSSFLEYFDNPDAALRGAIVSVYQAGSKSSLFQKLGG